MDNVGNGYLVGSPYSRESWKRIDLWLGLVGKVVIYDKCGAYVSCSRVLPSWIEIGSNRCRS